VKILTSISPAEQNCILAAQTRYWAKKSQGRCSPKKPTQTAQVTKTLSWQSDIVRPKLKLKL
jgi:hypothetical protein